MNIPWRHLWPRSLFGRIALILVLGLIITQCLAIALVYAERTFSTMGVMSSYLATDVSSAIAVLERVPPTEREQWLGKLARRNYHYLLRETPLGEPLDARAKRLVLEPLEAALKPSHIIVATGSRSSDPIIQVHTHLRDGTPLTIIILLRVLPVSYILVLAMLVQLIVMVGVTWFAVRLVTRPVSDLARAADSLGLAQNGHPPLEEGGPVEVMLATRAFNQMQLRIGNHLAERVRMLAAISHDLQTPITRMRLRCEILEEGASKDRLLADLDAMHGLVREVITYARDGQGVTETPRRTDVDALLDSLTCDYIDAGKQVHLAGEVGQPVVVAAHALRRIVTNLVDNALKFGQRADTVVSFNVNIITIAIRDNGPGIPENELTSVMQPFYRVEISRNRDTGGAGLGLAIAHQLTQALGGSIRLRNRSGGGLEAILTLPVTQ
jgi:signal transduction histidine kinase